MRKFLYGQTDNAPLVLFRIFFGFLLACETLGAVLTGWVTQNFIEPKFTFSHIGMEWLQPLPGYGMYICFIIMSVLGIMVMLGYKYRFSIISFTVLWAAVYFMQKTSYNNHYYLLLLISLIMCFMPANRYKSIDAAQHPEIKQYTMPAWCRWVMVAQISAVYFFATIAKLYPDWLNGSFTHQLLANEAGTGITAEVITSQGFALFIAWAGIAFDLLVVPLMLYKRTRTIALVASIIFHVFNSINLKIGIFPFFALSFAVFLYPPATISRIFFKHKPRIVTDVPYTGQTVFRYFFVPYLLLQLFLPLRHYFIKGDVLWTEEGHRLSWRMMLRSRTGHTNFEIKDKATGKELRYNLIDNLTPKQLQVMAAHPDMIWQMAQRIKKHFAAKGIEAAVYAHSETSVNQGEYRALINPKTDLASADYHYFGHAPWILLYEED
ncbi:HTTM domain-containing protein [Flavobacterium sp. RHBU_3]|uniref:HTTM domain-containing protein n=1 Tax=Flavobacterium sp. RHBU_3 TaxID=3391184 RepID=UPI0039847694